MTEIEKLAKVHVHPGDVVVLRFKGNLEAELFERVTKELKAYFPDNKTMVLAAGTALEVYSTILGNPE